MAWVVATCLLIDVADSAREGGRFKGGARHSVRAVFCGIRGGAQRTDAPYQPPRAAWHDYVSRRRAGPTPKRPLADVLIGAFALRHQGLLTRNAADFRQLFPQLKVLTP